MFWLQGISDEYLEQVYACACLVAASLNEGFGLPLIEAARHRVPIIARDIPVFREVAADCAFIFDEKPRDLTALRNGSACIRPGGIQSPSI
ncbi:MAG: glycosyltransferase [Desulfobacterales bacterium]|nr:glycosyltransferase [Desulfobacterales bacterium]